MKLLFLHRGGQQAALARGTTRRYRGTGVNASGRVERSTSDDDEEEESDEEEGRERVGFDRLRSVSLLLRDCVFSFARVSFVVRYLTPQRYLLSINCYYQSSSRVSLARKLLQFDPILVAMWTATFSNTPI